MLLFYSVWRFIASFLSFLTLLPLFCPPPYITMDALIFRLLGEGFHANGGAMASDRRPAWPGTGQHGAVSPFICFDPLWPARWPVRVWERCICCSFIFISGLCGHWGRRHALRRGLVLNGCGLLITAVTLIAVPEQAVWCGVLTFLGCATLLTIPVDRLLRGRWAVAGLAVSLVLLAVFWPVNRGWLGFGALQLWQLPDVLYHSRLLTVLGFPFAGFSSSDYFSILPWYFLFLAGYFARPLLFANEQVKKVARLRLPLLDRLGRKSLPVYLVHQPLCMAVCMVFLSPASPFRLVN